MTRLDAADHGIEALGYVVSYVALQDALDRGACVLRHRRAASRRRQRASRVRRRTQSSSPSDASTIRARLAVVADGTGTAVEGIARTRHDYGQVALIASVWLDRPHGGHRLRAVHAQGPMALLPERDHYGLVWTMRPHEGEAMLALDERAFLVCAVATASAPASRLQCASHRAACSRSHSSGRRPTRLDARGRDRQRSAATAPGCRAGLQSRPARRVGACAVDSRCTPRDALGSPAMLARYARAAQRDRGRGIAFTHGLMRMHSATIMPRSRGRAGSRSRCWTRFRRSSVLSRAHAVRRIR